MHAGDGVYGLPMDSGPMALFYNKEVFDKHSIAVPTTWDEYVDAARKLHAADPKVYIANDTGDAGFTTSMIWQAGGKPYKVDGTNVTIDFADAGSRSSPTPGRRSSTRSCWPRSRSWSDDWYKGLGDGTIATPDHRRLDAGQPRVRRGRPAPASGGSRRCRSGSAGGKASAENGGSSLAVPAGQPEQGPGVRVRQVRHRR